jgi:putative cell wall-binding protein
LLGLSAVEPTVPLAWNQPSRTVANPHVRHFCERYEEVFTKVKASHSQKPVRMAPTRPIEPASFVLGEFSDGPDRSRCRHRPSSHSQDAFDGGANRVYVVTGSNFPDALAGAAAAGWWDAPILLVGGTVPGSVSAEISRLGATHIFILGGTAVVSSNIATTLGALTGL